MINCLLGDDGVSSYEDNCSFTCNPGYVLTGSETRFCHHDRSWSGNESVCSRGIATDIHKIRTTKLNFKVMNDDLATNKLICNYFRYS